MRLEDIKKLVGDTSKIRNDTLPLIDLEEIKKKVNVELLFNENTEEYYYSMKTTDVMKADLKGELISENRWILSADAESLILIL